MNRLHKITLKLAAPALFWAALACNPAGADQPTIVPSPTTQPTATIATSTPTPTNTPQPTYTPSPTASPTATPSPTPTATPSPTATATASPTPTATPDLRADLEMTLGQYERTRYVDGVARYSIPYSVTNRGDADASNSNLIVTIEGREYQLPLPAIAKGQTIDDVLEMQLNPGEHTFQVRAEAERELKIDQKNQADVFIYERGQVTVLKEVMDVYQRLLARYQERGVSTTTIGWEQTMGSPSNPFRIYIVEKPEAGRSPVDPEAKQQFLELLEQWPLDLMNYVIVDTPEEHNILFTSISGVPGYGSAGLNTRSADGVFIRTWFAYNGDVDYEESTSVKGLPATLRGAINEEFFSAATGLDDVGLLGVSYSGKSTLSRDGARTPNLSPFDIAIARLHRAVGPGKDMGYIQSLAERGVVVVADLGDPQTADLAQELMNQNVYGRVHPGNPAVENSPIMGTTPVAQTLFRKHNMVDYNVWKGQQPLEATL